MGEMEGEFKMLKTFTYEMKCAMFAGSIFLIFFTSSIVSVARARTLVNDEAHSIPVDVNEELNPPGPILNNQQVFQAPNEPVIGDPPLSDDSPQIGDPNPYWTARINIWYQGLSNFYDSILSVLGF